MIFCANSTTNNEAGDVDNVVDKLADEVDKVDEINEVNEVDEVDEVDVDSEVDENENIVHMRDHTGLDLYQHTSEEQNSRLNSSSTKMAGSRIKNLLDDLLDKAYQNDEIVNSIIKAKQEGFWKLPADLIKQGLKLVMGDLTLNSGPGDSTRLHVKGKMYVPDDKRLRLFLLQQHHNPLIQGHSEYKSMLWKLLENWYWLGMPQDCKQYATNYSTCRRTKAYSTKKQGLLNPLPISNRKWMDLSLDFVINLPDCQQQNQTFWHILLMVDRLTKRRLYKLLKTLYIGEFIDAMHWRVFSAHKYSLSIVNDQGARWLARCGSGYANNMV